MMDLETWNTTVRIACSAENNEGVEAAKKILTADKIRYAESGFEESPDTSLRTRV
jgi:hypothetical protein